MNQNIEIQIPTLDYLEHSNLIKSKQTVNLLKNYDEYWINKPSSFNNSFYSKINHIGQIDTSKITSYCGVRPIITSPNLEKIILNNKITKNINTIEFGLWYTPINKSVKNKLTIEYNQNTKSWSLANTNQYQIAPITWYYDEIEKLLLSQKILFYSPILFKQNFSFQGDFQKTDLYAILNSSFIKEKLTTQAPKNKIHTLHM